jgi:hypothetical protein
MSTHSILNVLRTATVAATLLLMSGGAALAADHLDAPGTQADPAADINDLYAWMSADGSALNLVMTVFPAATDTSMFSDSVQYVFHLNSSQAYGEAATPMDIICTFDAAQTIQCWIGGGDYVTGDASDTAGILSEGGDVRVFAGLRDDPFYFNLEGFNETIAAVVDAAGGLTFDAAGCPALDAATSGVLVGQLQTAAGGGTAVDFFAPLNTLAIVMSIPTTMINGGGDILGVSASTRMAP